MSDAVQDQKPPHASATHGPFLLAALASHRQPQQPAGPGHPQQGVGQDQGQIGVDDLFHDQGRRTGRRQRPPRPAQRRGQAQGRQPERELAEVGMLPGPPAPEAQLGAEAMPEDPEQEGEGGQPGSLAPGKGGELAGLGPEAGQEPPAGTEAPGGE